MLIEPIVVALAEKVKWCASLCISKQRVGTIEEEEGDDARRVFTGNEIVIAKTSKMKSRSTRHIIASPLYINEGNDAMVSCRSRATQSTRNRME